MKKILFLFCFLWVTNTFYAQVESTWYNSHILNASRELKIQVPKGYDSNSKYPLILVLDGDYLFELVAGNVDYYSYWEDIPPAIVVGISQAKFRSKDNTFSSTNSLPIDEGAKFFEFIGAELLPYLNSKLAIGEFNVIVGHGKGANFINYYLLKEKPLFQSYIVLSPDLASDMPTYVSDILKSTSNRIFYYLAGAGKDPKKIQKDTKALNTLLSPIENKKILYKYNTFENATHYSLPAHAMSSALESIFFVYQPISKEEYKKYIVNLETSPVDYLLEKYKTIKDLFRIDKKIALNDFKAIDAAIKKNENWEYYEDLGKVARKEYPNTLLGNYFLGRYYEETGNYNKALKTYQSAYVFDEIGNYTKDFMLEKAEDIEVKISTQKMEEENLDEEVPEEETPDEEVPKEDE